MPDTINARLESATAGDPEAAELLLVVVYDELKRMAHSLLRRESGSRTLCTTALVHEAYLKLVGSEQVSQRGRSYLFGAAARAMRQVLVDAARSRQRLKRGGDEPAVPLSDFDPPDHLPSTVDILAVDAALTELAQLFPRQAQVVECRFFGGLSVEETAAVMESSPRTVKRDWALAQAWLYRHLSSSD